ncbi:hypothetical protein [Nocardia sp. NPDC127526]|uniref:hypothetical protein n=1 Tax=Nocardia sp. NPDC127526 TaxID=3345393 RepID=UPI00363FAF11
MVELSTGSTGPGSSGSDSDHDVQELPAAEAGSGGDEDDEGWASISAEQARRALPPGTFDFAIKSVGLNNSPAALLEQAVRLHQPAANTVRSVFQRSAVASLDRAFATWTPPPTVVTASLESLELQSQRLVKDLAPVAAAAWDMAGMLRSEMVVPAALPRLEDFRFPVADYPVVDVVTGLASSRSLDVMVPRIDLGAVWQVANVARQLAPLDLLPGLRTWDWFPRSVHEEIVGLLGSWEILRKAGHRRAARGLRAARRARAAVLNFLGAEADAVVADFAVHWLGYAKAKAYVVEAVAAALLDDQWLGGDDPLASLDTLKGLTEDHHRVQKPLFKQKLRGGRVLYLSEPLGDGDDSTTVGDFLVFGQDARIDGYEDSRVVEVLNRLEPEERRIAYAHSEYRTWEEAARHCGFPPAAGEAVRRKIKRVGQKVDQLRQERLGSREDGAR